jgi:hypothetical protein
VAVEFGGSEGGDGEGTLFGPVPAGAAEALADELFAARFDLPRSWKAVQTCQPWDLAAG